MLQHQHLPVFPRPVRQGRRGRSTSSAVNCVSSTILPVRSTPPGTGTGVGVCGVRARPGRARYGRARHGKPPGSARRVTARNTASHTSWRASSGAVPVAEHLCAGSSAARLVTFDEFRKGDFVSGLEPEHEYYLVEPIWARRSFHASVCCPQSGLYQYGCARGLKSSNSRSEFGRFFAQPRRAAGRTAEQQQ